MNLTEEDVKIIINQLRVKARAEYAARLSLDGLGTEQRQDFTRAISIVIRQDIATFTFAQIIDDLPTADVAWNSRLPGIFGFHPFDEHEELCPGALEKAQELCKAWTLDVLSFKPQLLNSFRGAGQGSKQYQAGLIELVAVALHQFGVLLFQLDFRLHKGDINHVTNWVMPRDGEPPYLPRPTLFNHPSYLHNDIYPEDTANIVGYWVEDRILGGVAVFDRKCQERSDEAEAPNVYWHSCREKVPSRVYQLRDDQQEALADFLLNDGDGEPVVCPLPILGDDKNTVRVDAWEAIPPTREEVWFWERRPRSALGYPEDPVQLIKVNAELGISFSKSKRDNDGEGDSTGGIAKAQKLEDEVGDKLSSHQGP